MENIDLNNYKKIMIIGNSSAGKSTLANQLSTLLNIPAYHLDMYYFKPNGNWESIPKEDFIEKHNDILKNKSWIIDGNYSGTEKDRMIEADLVILINISRFTSMYKFILRLFDDHRHGCPEGCSNKMELAMIKYILWTYPKKAKRRAAQLKGNEKVFLINSFRELIQFKKSLNLKTKGF